MIVWRFGYTKMADWSGWVVCGKGICVRDTRREKYIEWKFTVSQISGIAVISDFFYKEKNLCKTHYLGGWLTQWLSRRLVRMMVPIRCSSLQLSCSICVLRSCSLCCFFSLQRTWLRVGGGPTSIAGRAHRTFWQVHKGSVHFLTSYTTFNIDRQLARVGDRVGLRTDHKSMLLCRTNTDWYHCLTPTPTRMSKSTSSWLFLHWADNCVFFLY